MSGEEPTTARNASALPPKAGTRSSTAAPGARRRKAATVSAKWAAPPSARSSRVTEVTTTCRQRSSAAASATRSGSVGSGRAGTPEATPQKAQPRVHTPPRRITVAVPFPQHSPTFGQRASPQTVRKPCRASAPETASTRSPDGARTVSQAGRPDFPVTPSPPFAAIPFIVVPPGSEAFQAADARGGDRIADLAHRGRPPPHLGHGGGLPPLEAAEVDAPEVGEVRGDVQREAVVGDPLPDPDADRGDLPLPDPHAGQPVEAAPRDPELREGVDQRRLDGADEPVDIRPLHEADGVPHQLPGTVIGDVAAPAHALHGDPFPGERLPRDEEIRLVPRAPQGVNVGVGQEQERVGDL